MVNSEVKQVSNNEIVNVGLFENLAQAKAYNEANYTPPANYQFKYTDSKTGEELTEE